jgi:hypothetical protein
MEKLLFQYPILVDLDDTIINLLGTEIYRLCDLYIIKKFHTRGACLYEFWSWSARLGNIEVAEWLRTRCDILAMFPAMDIAAKYGHLEFMKYMYERGDRCSSDASIFAAKHGYLDIIKWLDEYHKDNDGRIIISPEAIVTATRYDNFEIVKWLFLNKPEVCRDSLASVLGINNHISRWMREQIKTDLYIDLYILSCCDDMKSQTN